MTILAIQLNDAMRLQIIIYLFKQTKRILKKLFTALVITLVILSSCKKENTQCYDCTFGTVNGYTRPPETVCVKDESELKFKDANGNDLQSFCTKR